MRRHATHDRDNSLRRLSRVNRWLIAGSLTLTGVLTEVAAHAFPSSAAGSGAASAHAKPKRRNSHNGRLRTHHNASTSALKPPAHAPEASGSSAEPSGEVTSEPSAEATHEAAPEAAPPAEQAAPAPEAAPEVQTAPERPHETEASTPVVSGGS
ncbi:MAG TPA: hypothetical protein VGI52_09280 [Solirubrobacteraceae bacterium]|jgi:hypothetical protein